MEFPILSTLTWLPIIGGIAVLLAARGGDALPRQLALGVSIITFVLSLLLWQPEMYSTAAMQFEEFVPWIEAFNVNYHLGIDGILRPSPCMAFVKRSAKPSPSQSSAAIE